MVKINKQLMCKFAEKWASEVVKKSALLAGVSVSLPLGYDMKLLKKVENYLNNEKSVFGHNSSILIGMIIKDIEVNTFIKYYLESKRQ